jgi:hypothetical protein
MSKHYSLSRAGRFLLAASTISGIALLSALAADANTLPSAGTPIENQATAEFTDEATNTSSAILSDKVTVTVAEVAGITGTNNGVIGPVYRTRVVNFDFKITNSGNDPTKFFIPGTVSKAIYQNATGVGQAIPTAKIGDLRLIAYRADNTASTSEIAIAESTTNNVTTTNKISTAGESTGTVPALIGTANTNNGSIKPGGYVVIRVPVEIPYDAVNGTDNIEVTLGNTATPPQDNQVKTANGGNGTGNDLYTVDNDDNTNDDATGTPVNGEKEVSMVQKASVVEPTAVTISGTVYDDRNNSGANNGTILTADELGTDGMFGTETTKVRAVLVNRTTGKVIASQIVQDGTGGTTKGAYKFTGVPGITDVKVILAKVDGVATQSPPANALPDTWVKTAEIFRDFRTELDAIPNQDFGIRQKGKLILLKRITKVGTTVTGDDSADTYNGTGTNWPSDFIKGKVNAGKVQPGQEIEYTIYFLNNQGADVTKARICDQIKGAQTYEADSMTLGVWNGTAVAPSTRTDAATDNDKASTFALGNTVDDCNLGSNNTATDPGVLVDIATSANKIPSAKPNATGVVTYPNGSYGYFRFKTKVNGTTP